MAELGGHGHTGIVNPTNSVTRTKYFCYANAFLQCLGRTKDYRDFVLENLTANCIDRRHNEPEESRLAYAIHLFISQLWSNKFSSLRTDHIRNEMRPYANAPRHRIPMNNDARNFIHGDQQDSYEFADFVLYVLHKAYNVGHDTKPREPNEFGRVKGKKYESIQHYKDRVRAQNDTIIFNCFSYFYNTQIQCTECGDIRFIKPTEAKIMAVYFPENVGPHYLKAMIEYNFIKKCMESGLMQCYGCREREKKKKGDVNYYEMTKPERLELKQRFCIAKACIVAPSEYLIIHLCRFNLNNETLVQTKITDEVIFEFENLDLTSCLAEYIQKDRVEARYDLYGIVCHFGDIGGGHYVAYAKLGDEMWRQFDDERVTWIPTVDELVAKQIYKYGYILFYRLQKGCLRLEKTKRERVNE